ncbi:MAG: T9SS type A sorting domain-containing protein [Chitinophagaceae bacterium]|nr:T9SS type A sorting domain-containing protein [Chitinophagaceae bacterium]
MSILNTVACARVLTTANTFAFTTSSASPLPVELLYFDVQAGNGQEVLAQWATAQEEHSAWFVLQRQSGTGQWVEVGRIPAVGYSQVINRYSLRDENALPGINYYRLQQLDIDQHSTYSPVRQVLFKQGESTILIYPNPMQNQLTIQSATALNQMPYVLSDVQGRVLMQGQLNDRVNTLSMSHLSKGLYFLRLGEGDVQTFRIIRD